MGKNFINNYDNFIEKMDEKTDIGLTDEKDIYTRLTMYKCFNKTNFDKVYFNESEDLFEVWLKDGNILLLHIV